MRSKQMFGSKNVRFSTRSFGSRAMQQRGYLCRAYYYHGYCGRGCCNDNRRRRVLEIVECALSKAVALCTPPRTSGRWAWSRLA